MELEEEKVISRFEFLTEEENQLLIGAHRPVDLR